MTHLCFIASNFYCLHFPIYSYIAAYIFPIYSANKITSFNSLLQEIVVNSILKKLCLRATLSYR